MMKRSLFFVFFSTLGLLPLALAAEICTGFGPQTPRDIDNLAGKNPRVFSMAPAFSQMNLCNIHFHKHAEHKAKEFSVAAEGGQGYRCNATSALTPEELEPATSVCKNIEPGDTIEVHWVHTSCDLGETIEPEKGLGACSTSACQNPQLRVETQVFLVVNDPSARDFEDFAYRGNVESGLHQAKAIPDDTGAPVRFLGSTTGDKFSQSKCSPLQVSWSVRPQCAKVDIGSLDRWCKNNAFKEEEDYGHGVRPLVVAPELLSVIE